MFSLCVLTKENFFKITGDRSCFAGCGKIVACKVEQPLEVLVAWLT